MSYVTNFNLQIENDDFTAMEAFSAIKYIANNVNHYYGIYYDNDGEFGFEQILNELLYSKLKRLKNDKVNLLKFLFTTKGQGWIITTFLDDAACKWYEWKDDMLTLSKICPRILFALSGRGEDQPDLWKCYFKGGKSQLEEARIEYDDFDEEKLK